MIDLSRFNNDDFDRGASRWTEWAWWLFRAVFFLAPIPLPSSLRAMVLRLFGAKVGHGVVIRKGVDISFPWRIAIGDHAWIGQEVMILSLDEVKIGKSACISQRVFLCTGSHDFRSDTFDLRTSPIEIGESAWVAACCFVGPGVKMHAGSMATAGSVVVSDVPTKTIVGGSPAEFVSEV